MSELSIPSTPSVPSMPGYDFADPSGISGLKLWLRSDRGITSSANAVDDPTDIANLTAWYRSDLGVTSSSNLVSKWEDQSGNGNDLVQSTGTKQPLLVANQINGQPAIRFDGSDDFMQVTFGAPVAQPITIFMVIKNITFTNAKYLFDGKTNASVLMSQIVPGNVIGVYAGSAYQPQLPVDTSNWMFIHFVINGGSSASRMMGGTNVAATATPGANTLDGITVGAAGGGGSAANFDIAELIVYGAAVSDANRIRIEDYLLARYNFGYRISQMNDLSGNSSNATQTTVGYNPILLNNQITGHPAIRFDGTDDYLDADGAAGTFNGDDTPYTWFCVFKMRDVSTSNFTLWSFSSTTAHYKSYVQTLKTGPKYHLIRYANDSDSTVDEGTPDATAYHYAVINFHGTTLSMRVDGTTIADSASFNNASMQSYIDKLTVGAYQFNSQAPTAWGPMDLVEFGLFNSDLADGYVAQLENYFKARYNL